MQRLIDFEGCLNFRDLGGYPTSDGRQVKWRQVFRSDALHLLTATDVDRFRDELGIRDVVDLRSTVELRGDSNRPLAQELFRLHHTPLFDGEAVERAERAERIEADMTLAARYLALTEFARHKIARVVEIIADAPAPVVYHCAAGKDRTGVISAVVLGSIGVRDEVIAADYAATRDNLEAIVDRLLSTEGYRDMLEALPPDTMHAEPETMLGLLEGLRERYGSVNDYLRAAGVSSEALSRLGSKLLD